MTMMEVMAVIAHELGHIKCSHVLYKTMARGIKPLIEIVTGSIPIAGKVLGSGIEAGLLTWNRRSELSADRAALLVMQDARPCVSMLMKLAGGTERHVQWLDAEQFLLQARAYKEGLDQSMSDRLYRFVVNMRATHPFAVERARMLDDWVGSPEYNSILAGHYSDHEFSMARVSLCPHPNCAKPTQLNAMFCGECGTPLRVN